MVANKKITQKSIQQFAQTICTEQIIKNKCLFDNGHEIHYTEHLGIDWARDVETIQQWLLDEFTDMMNHIRAQSGEHTYDKVFSKLIHCDIMIYEGDFICLT